jgi:hypothetical protein
MSAIGQSIEKPIYQKYERRIAPARRSSDGGEHAVEACFAVLTVVILGMMVGIGA